MKVDGLVWFCLAMLAVSSTMDFFIIQNLKQRVATLEASLEK